MIALHNAVAQSIAVSGRLSSLGYSGEHFDAKAAQQYLRARFYDPANGRFNRLDPFAGNMQDPQSLHKYTYVHGDPIANSDPSGKFAMGVVANVFVGTASHAVQKMGEIKSEIRGLYLQHTGAQAIQLLSMSELDLDDWFRIVTRTIEYINRTGQYLGVVVNAIATAVAGYEEMEAFFSAEYWEVEELGENVQLGRSGKFGGKNGWWKRNRKYYRKRTVNGKRVEVSKNKFDPNVRAKDRINKDDLANMKDGDKKRLIENGATNKELMENGYAPIGRDGKPMNLHHSTRNYKQGREPQTLIELPGGVHSKYDGELHNIIGNSAVDRAAFKAYREAYWRWRAQNPGHGI